MIQIIHGDCLEKLKEIPDNSIDSIVTDPPYGLSFMGKKWDYDVPSEEVWRECLRVLKPGGHLLSFAGTRTQHRMAVRIEDAGFEIRDMIMYVYGSGFPKSLNIAKSIESKLKTGSCAKNNFHQLEGERRDGRIGMYDTVEEQGFRKNNPDQLGAFDLEATTEEAKQWEGWGTALKPALEPITVARKPLIGTVAENCLKWGTGGINIDQSRIPTEETITNHSRGAESAVSKGKYGDSKAQETHQTSGQTFGRWPANLIHDGSEEVLELFPTTGPSRAGGKGKPLLLAEGEKDDSTIQERGGYNEPKGSAARFFKECKYTNEDLQGSRLIYCAKASKKDRDEGLEGFEEKQAVGGGGGIGDYLEDVNSASGKFGSEKAPAKNSHPTVKPTALMRYLVKLVTPPGGTVLDPFTGSGSTGKACKLEGFDFIGIELDKEYFEIAKARIGV